MTGRYHRRRGEVVTDDEYIDIYRTELHDNAVILNKALLDFAQMLGNAGIMRGGWIQSATTVKLQQKFTTLAEEALSMVEDLNLTYGDAQTMINRIKRALESL